MATVNVPNTEFARAGIAPASLVPGDTTNGHDVVNDGKVVLYVENSDTTNAATVTVVSSATLDGLDVTDLTVSIPASGKRYIGPFSEATFSRSLTVHVSAATLSLAAYHMAPA